MFSNNPAQNFLKFEGIKDGTLILKNKSLRGVLLTSSVNFDLKSEDEQKATTYQFQSFLNSLDFSTQIIVQSRRLNITGYFDKLKELEEKQKSELLKVQISGYRKFVEKLIKKGTIMKKEFFVVVPFTLNETIGVSGGLLQNIFKGGGGEDKYFGLGKENFQRARDQLWQRMEYAAIGLRRCGLNAVPLTTPELIELFWALHHPRQSEFGYYPEILPELLD